MDVYFDVETKSSKDLKTVGAINYFNTSASDFVCIGYRTTMREPTRAWVPTIHKSIPQVFREPHRHTFYAFNITFDKLSIDYLGPKYGFEPIPIENCIDVMALVSRYGFPSSLAKAGEALGVKIQKDRVGALLMNKITQPPWQYTTNDLKKFIKYCMTDVDSMCEIINALPASNLSPDEQDNWIRTFEINMNGIPVDTSLIRRVYTVINKFMEEVGKEVPLITGDEIQTINQRDKIIAWVAARGIHLPDFTKDTIEATLQRSDLPNDVRALLNIRQMIGLSSIKKYRTLLMENHKGRMYQNLKYYGGHTGREAGLKFQIQNLPKGTLKTKEEIDVAIQKFYNPSGFKGNPVHTAKDLVRPIIKATAHNMLAVHDYSSIEHVIILWVADELEALENLREGGDNYVKFVSAFYHILEEEVTKSQRNFGKTAILGCGFMMGASRLYDTCLSFGIETTYEECDDAVKLFRTTFPRIVNTWYRLKDCAVKALNNPGTPFNTNNCSFTYIADRNSNPWLALKLPSGRTMYYCKPVKGTANNFGPVYTYLGVHPITKKFTRLEAGPNKIIENIVQATARDILMDGRKRIMEHYKLITSIHDENVTEVPEQNYMQHWLHIKQLMEEPPSWGRNMPLKVSGYCEKRYRKD